MINFIIQSCVNEDRQMKMNWTNTQTVSVQYTVRNDCRIMIQNVRMHYLVWQIHTANIFVFTSFTSFRNLVGNKLATCRSKIKR